jgi:hypothetical protein
MNKFIIYFSIVLILLLPNTLSKFYGASFASLVLLRILSTLLILVLLFLVNKIFKSTLLKIITIITIFLFFCANSLEMTSFYLQATSFNEAFWYHFSLNTFINGIRITPYLVIFFIVFLIILISLSIYSIQQIAYIQIQKKIALSLFTLAILSIIFSPTSLQQLVFSFYDINRINILSSSNEAFISDKNNTKSLIYKNNLISKPGKNLLFIYLESIESIYLDDKIFPGLMPNLQRLSKEGLTFTNLYQFHNVSFTTAGIIASQCGLTIIDPQYDPDSFFSIRKDYMKNLVCLGDVLNKAGYYQVYMGGADVDFGGKGLFFQNHGYNLTLGKAELKNYLPSKKYLTAWGLYDDSLFNLALLMYKKLSAMDKPFNLTLLTLDTHVPGGETSLSCPEYKKNKNSMLNAVHCTDYLLGIFISEIKKQPLYKNTVIALIADHLAPKKVAMNLYPADYDRKLFATFLNTGEKGKIDVLSSPFDLAPTILNIINVNSNAEFLLGENVLDNPSKSRLDIVKSKGVKHLVKNIINQSSNNDFGKICNDNYGIKGYQIEEKNIYKILFSTNEEWVKLDYMFFRNFRRSLWVKIGEKRKIKDYGIARTKELLKIINQDNDYAYFILTHSQEIDLSNTNNLITKISPGFFHYYIKNPYKPEIKIKGKFESLNLFNINKKKCNSLLEV